MLKKSVLILIALVVGLCNTYAQNLDKSFELKMN
jgi:hypothetical protein